MCIGVRHGRCSRSMMSDAAVTNWVTVDGALADLDWRPRFGLEDGYRDSYRWYQEEGRDLYEFDFTADDEIVARVNVKGRTS